MMIIRHNLAILKLTIGWGASVGAQLRAVGLVQPLGHGTAVAHGDVQEFGHDMVHLLLGINV